MSLSRKASLIFTAAFILGAFCGLATFRIILSFTPLGERLQDRFNEACAYGGETDRLEKLYLAGAFPNGRIIDGGPWDDNGYPPDPPLHQAAWFGNAEVVQWLIDHGAAVNSRVDQGDGFSTALDEAEGHLKETQRAIDILKAHGAKNAYQK